MLLTPSWLYYLFAALMLVVAAYCVVLLVISAISGRWRGADVELSHVFMGVAMAGMFVAGWEFGPSVMWELVFGALFVWFVVRGIQSIQTYGIHLPHTFVHALMSFAMLLMYWFPMGSASGKSPTMTMTSSASGGRIDPGLAFLVAFALLASAIFTVASPRKGAAVYGTHVAATGGVGSAVDSYLVDAPASVPGVEGSLASPVLVDATHVLMCVAMAFMLVLML